MNRLPDRSQRAAEPMPQPPFQVRGVRMLFLEGRVPQTIARRMLPSALRPAKSGALQMAIYTAPEGWGLAPYAATYLRLALSGRDSPDGSPALFNIDQSASLPASEILSHHYGGDVATASSRLVAGPQVIAGEGGLSAGGRLTIRARRCGAMPTAFAGAHSQMFMKDSVLCEFSTAYSLMGEDLALEDWRLDLPKGHRLSGLAREFEPLQISYLHDKSFALGQPHPVQDAAGSPSDVVPALIEMLGRLRLPVLVFLMSGKLVHVSAAAEAFGPRVEEIAAALRRQALVGPPRTHAPLPGGQLGLTLSDGSTEVVRVIPLAPALWGQSALLCVLAGGPQRLLESAEPLLGLIGLTRSEARIARTLASGATAPEAGRQLGLSPHTVRSALKVIYLKLGISSRAELATLVGRLLT